MLGLLEVNWNLQKSIWNGKEEAERERITSFGLDWNDFNFKLVIEMNDWNWNSINWNGLTFETKMKLVKNQFEMGKKKQNKDGLRVLDQIEIISAWN